MGPNTIEAAGANGINSLFAVNPLTTVLVLAIMGLCWFVKSLMNDLRDAHQKAIDTLISNTTVMSEMKEMVRAAIQNK